MPFIHIKSLPFKQAFESASTLININREFSEKNNIPEFHIHSSWEFYLPGHYAKGDQAPSEQPDNFHPVIVDLLTPDFNDNQTIAGMLSSLADSIHRHAPVAIDRIFINHRQAHSGMIFDDGKVVSW
ncbi:MAG: hypothetical protein OEZ38_14995 [Gammaproteobacteria bacterium]|nr:hypothetical protein [Gammaproteobacteria bacterium]